jgi:hypothetical protein
VFTVRSHHTSSPYIFLHITTFIHISRSSFFYLTLPLGLWVTHRAFDLQEDWGFVAPATEDELDHAAKQLAASFPANDVEWVRRTVAAAANPCVCTLRCPQGGVPNDGPSKGGKGGRHMK